MDLLSRILVIFISFLIMVGFSPIVIPLLRRLKFGQSIREEGPQSHMKKTGTPTMGGILFIIATVLTSFFAHRFLTGSWFLKEFGLLMFVFLGFGTLGFLDDFIKVILKRNLGLTSLQKLMGQIVVGAVFFLMAQDLLVSEIVVPFSSLTIDLAWLYPVFVVVLLVGSSNAVNLTDGLDGLVAGLGAISFFAFSVLASSYGGFETVEIVGLSIVGSLLGFLVFNKYPAKVFMGDTGSLALGGLLGAISVLLHQELLLIILGGVFVIETLSVMIQVVSFKTRGKRVFLMSPIHHHFELKGWSEWKVVGVFWSVGLLLALLTVIYEVII
ncbi:phospho-N-acetylmuramoyl-pentapeptide-transferase [Streptohalobacillus salinus]|uniref:Phospho-N-acetylmuramoyl-pentapeptide-transferase n=1 Tax=Streptohalobacillus salinus TaxID=621096 RepID=A0A2V3WGU1_9BACI|nr:phospho-N-acetylmuramoyl-pentapeptide-transferase [Streptohalobacillus salinus]PXW92611.1 phospho-N-acetylmuramoyl-pentapeptide-transferase [Streptohalobacillus salinus]